MRKIISPMKISTVTSRLNIPISSLTRSELEVIASQKGLSLAELGRQAIEAFLIEERRQRRLEKLCATATRHADLINSVGAEWSSTETDGWQDD